jgi:glycosyltransferase involved in cell wall biosynthesis
MRLSVISVVWNEAYFMPIFLESVSRYADEILILDGGSTDGTLGIIRKYQEQGLHIDLTLLPQPDVRYSREWLLCQRRDLLLAKASGDWILSLDADEVIDDRFAREKEALLSSRDTFSYVFKLIQFWRDPQTLRLNSEHDPHWEGVQVRLWPNGLGIYHDEEPHAVPYLDGRPLWEYPCRLLEMGIFHYHYALGERIRSYDLRLGDVAPQYGASADWNYPNPRLPVITKSFDGEHPEIIKTHLARQRIS